jgi:hypothetical protein
VWLHAVAPDPQAEAEAMQNLCMHAKEGRSICMRMCGSMWQAPAAEPTLGPCLALACTVASRTDSANRAARHVIPSHFAHQCLTLGQTRLQAAPKPMYQKLYAALFKGRLAQLAADPVANFVVQAAAAAVQEKALVNEMVSELKPVLGSLLRSRR